MSRALLPLLLILAAVSAFAFRTGLRTQAAEVYGVVPDFSLVDSSGKEIRSSDIAGPWIADFIFTRCSGQCPMMTEKMREIEGALPGVRLVSISVDAYDRPSVLARYAREQRVDWLFLSGKPGQVAGLCRDVFKLPVAPGASRKDILHSSRFVLVDGSRRIRGYFDANDPAGMAQLIAAARSLR